MDKTITDRIKSGHETMRVRVTPELKELVVAGAAKAGITMNAEITVRLWESYRPTNPAPNPLQWSFEVPDGGDNEMQALTVVLDCLTSRDITPAGQQRIIQYVRSAVDERLRGQDT